MYPKLNDQPYGNCVLYDDEVVLILVPVESTIAPVTTPLRFVLSKSVAVLIVVPEKTQFSKLQFVNFAPVNIAPLKLHLDKDEPVKSTYERLAPVKSAAKIL